MPRLTKQERRDLHIANQRWHFKKRARKRLGLFLSEAEVDAMVARIKEDKPGVRFLVQRPGSSTWRLRWRKRTIVVVYDHRTEQLVTCFRYHPERWQ